MAQNEASIDEKFFLFKYGTVSQKGGIYMKAKKLVAVGMTVLMLGGLFVGCGILQIPRQEQTVEKM